MTGAKPVHNVCVGIGSNIDRERNIHSCIAALIAAFGRIAASSVYESDAAGYEGAPYYNLAVCFETALSVGEVDRTLRAIEEQHGRVRGAARFADRTLDVDLLLYDDLHGEFEGIALPREEIALAAHVLLPLSEIAGDRVVPGTGRRVMDLWREFANPPRIEAVRFRFEDRWLPARL